ncbi:hypothetical protein Tco_1242277 [Tanacetum coccineum]
MHETYVGDYTLFRKSKSHNVLGIAIGLAIIIHQLPFEYTIASRSTDVMGPISPAPAANSTTQVLADWNAVYDAHNEVACLMLGNMTPELHRKFENYLPYEMLQELKSIFEKQDGGYVEQLERLGYVLPQDLSVSLILNGLTNDFAGELQALLIEYEKGLTKKAATPKVMAIQSGEIQKSNKKSRNAKGKGKRKGKGKDKS